LWQWQFSLLNVLPFNGWRDWTRHRIASTGAPTGKICEQDLRIHPSVISRDRLDGELLLKNWSTV
jgi:hypothetical protein